MRDNQSHLARTRIRANCPACGEVELRGPDVALKVCTQPERSFYSFTCPACVQVISKPADERVIRLLASGGVKPDFWEPPAELLERHDGPASATTTCSTCTCCWKPTTSGPGSRRPRPVPSSSGFASLQ